jgi:hypothetical protein
MAVRVTFHEVDPAEDLVQTLTMAGYDAGVSRERFAGDDDGEEVVHVVHTDAPAAEVDELLGDSDGYVEESSPLVQPSGELPDAPIRQKKRA